MNKELSILLSDWTKRGCTYTVYPRLKKISLNGFPRITYNEAILLLREQSEKIKNRDKA